jgi:hypothetical protein
MRTFTAWLKHWWIAVAAFGLGAIVLAASWIIPNLLPGDMSGWWEAVLTNVGAAILLIAPIAWASERLTRQVDSVREDVEDTRVQTAAVREDVRRVREETSQTVAGLRQEVASLRDLSERVRARRLADMEQEAGTYRRLGLNGEEPTRSDVIAALKLATENGVVDDVHGPRAEMGAGSGAYLRLSYVPNDFDDSDLFFEVQSEKGYRIASVAWDEGVPTDDVVLDVLKALRNEGVSAEFDVGTWLQRISETMVAGASSAARHRIIQLCPPQWAVTARGLRPTLMTTTSRPSMRATCVVRTPSTS